MTTFEKIAKITSAIAAILDEIRWADLDERKSLREELSRLREELASLQS